MSLFSATTASAPAGILTDAEVWSRVEQAAREGSALSRYCSALNAVISSQLVTTVMGPAPSLSGLDAEANRDQLRTEIREHPGICL